MDPNQYFFICILQAGILGLYPPKQQVLARSILSVDLYIHLWKIIREESTAMKTIQIAISILLMVLLTSPRVNAALSRADLNSDADSVFPLGSSTTEEQASSRKSLRSNRRLKLYDGWNMLWQDEFDFLDSNKWGYQFGDGCQINLCGWGNGEMVSLIRGILWLMFI